MDPLAKSFRLSHFIDHTLLKAEAVLPDFEKLTQEAIEFSFAAVCVSPQRVKFCRKLIDASRGFRPRLATVVGFPLGYNTLPVKLFETSEALHSGADEIDMVLAIGLLKEGDLAAVESEIFQIKKLLGSKILKVIIETALLTPEEKIAASHLATQAGADFVKTSTGFAGGATVEDVELIKQTVPSSVKIKASGGIRDFESALKLVQAGANRLGTSNGVKILQTFEKWQELQRCNT